MLDDTKELIQDGQGSPVPRQPINLQANVDEILKARITRAHATQWAQNLLYLTFDDSLDERCAEPMIIEDNDTQHGQCQQCQQKDSFRFVHMCSNHLCRSYGSQKKEAGERNCGDPCFHVSEHSCGHCRPLPLFPNEKVTRFRLRRFRNFCNHFVAVSYCWSSEKGRAVEDTGYEVVEEDGTVRNARASNNTIDRAVAFARENGFRLIWIDQECIEQTDPYKKELAIQAMDYVYAMAHTTIGLLHAELQQEHLDCLSRLLQSQSRPQQNIQRGGRRALTTPRPIDPSVLAEAVSLIVNDEWNARAWILQEAFASSGWMILLFPKAAPVDVRGGHLICPKVSLSELAVDIGTLRRCLHIACGMIQEAMGPAKPATPRGRTRGERLQRRKPKRGQGQGSGVPSADTAMALERVLYFHPGNVEASASVWINNSKPRRTCSAATALTYLRLRDLGRVADKLAIVANLCDYHLRLNTTELEKTQQSLATCMLTLSLVNGDFTLLTPQLYRGLPETSKPEYAAASEPEFSWLHSFSRHLQQIDSDIWNPYGYTTGLNAGSHKLSSEGLDLMGALWNVNQFVDMTMLQIKYADSWMKLCQQDHLTSSFRRSIRLATTHLLFEILQTLVSMDERQVADSILNSVSNWKWLRRQDAEPESMVESVDEFPPGLQVQHRRDMFSLDPSPDGRYHQCWVIDRIMEKGGLWVGSLIEATAEDGVTDMSTGPEANSRAPGTGLALEATTSTSGRQDLPRYEPLGEGEKTMLDRTSHHLGSMRVMSMMGMLISHLSEEQGDLDEQPTQAVDEDKRLFHLKMPRVLGPLAMAFASVKTDGRDRQGRRAIFDMDGTPNTDNLVLVPFQATLESIPRPPLRSLSVSWIVEPESRDQDAGDLCRDGRYVGRLRVRRMTKGMWRFARMPYGAYTII
ncbi:putative heterokaryon incompatibility [Rosellinia necatrix]|uniref:Putative heterokaryon incompatibility n=1 Tax=Rosellinia necatrix TaxID=77044 RepID=A0A1W2TU88_ROSNE|nr:putative heterokaryon incompatibility [Rosellinia necatrix]